MGQKDNDACYHVIFRTNTVNRNIYINRFRKYLF